MSKVINTFDLDKELLEFLHENVIISDGSKFKSVDSIYQKIRFDIIEKYLELSDECGYINGYSNGYDDGYYIGRDVF